MTKYFVYGALMRNKLVQLKGKAAYLPDYDIEFSIQGIRVIEPGFATLTPKKGAQAWGVFVEMDLIQWQRISSHEVSYQLDNVTVYDLNYQAHQVKALIPKKPQPKVWQPSSRYARMLYQSACHFNFPNDVKLRYENAFKKGNKLTRYIPWLIPTTKKTLSRFGKTYGTYIGLMLSALPFIFVIFGIIYYLLRHG